MKYMGSKSRIAKHILPIILADRKENQWYVEPFVGGANLIDKVEGNRLGADNNFYLIEALKLIQQNLGGIPKHKGEWSELDYRLIKNGGDCFPGLKGYCGFQLSYGGKWFGGWRRDKIGKRDYVAEGYRNSVKQSAKIQGVEFVCSNYFNLNIPPNSIIYCDPPYAGTTKYRGGFDHGDFWNWCRDKIKQRHKVYVSEYSAPDDFECIWQKEIVSSLTKNTGSKKGVEKLFILVQ